MKIYGHPWSINTRKTLMTLAEKGHEAALELVMIPKGEHKKPDYLALSPFGKVPAIDDDGFVLYETRAINAYLDRKLAGPRLSPSDPRAAARLDQWTNVADAYFVPHVGPLIFETLFRRYLGGEQNTLLIENGRKAILPALDAADRWLASHPYFAGDAFSLADIHWMPYIEYLLQIGEGEPIKQRKSFSAWWERVGGRDTWRSVARSGPQPYEPGMTVDVIEKAYRR
jgi:glutathione S-transferase